MKLICIITCSTNKTLVSLFSLPYPSHILKSKAHWIGYRDQFAHYLSPQQKFQIHYFLIC